MRFCGDVDWGDDDQDQRLNQERFAAGVECGFVRLTSSASAYEAVQRAFYLARTESRPIMFSGARGTFRANHLTTARNTTRSTELMTNQPKYPNPHAIETAADLVARSEHPVIIVGRGALRSGAGEIVTKLADRIGALIATSVMAMNWPHGAGEYHVGVSGLFSTRVAMELFQDADVVIAAGASLNRRDPCGRLPVPERRVHHIDVNDQVIMGDGRSASCYVQSDARLGLELLDQLLEGRSGSQNWLSNC